MSSVLGVSIGASTVRLVCPDAVSLEGPVIRSQTVDATRELPEDLAADSIATVLTDRADLGEVQTIGIAYRDQAQAGAVQAAMAHRQVGNYRLVPEVTAALGILEVSGELGDHSTLVFYDLGSSGLTVTVVERSTGTVFGTARTDQISGDLIDRLIREDQLELRRIAPPVDAAAQLALDARCRHAKEELSTRGAACVPGDGGLLMLSRESFDTLIEDAVETSARLAREVVDRSGCVPDAVVLIGGGAHIPLVPAVLEEWLDLPAIVPEQPELVAAEGAALLAEPAVVPVPESADDALTAPLAVVTRPQQTPPPEWDTDAERTGAPSTTPARLSTVARLAAKQVTKPGIHRTALVGGTLLVAAAIGLGLGYGGDLLPGSEGDPRPVTTQPNTPAPIVEEAAPPRPTTATEPPPASPPPAASAAWTEAERGVPAPAPAPSPPPPGPIIPGLPQIQQIQLPPLPLPELPRIPGL